MPAAGFAAWSSTTSSSATIKRFVQERNREPARQLRPAGPHRSRD